MSEAEGHESSQHTQNQVLEQFLSKRESSHVTAEEYKGRRRPPTETLHAAGEQRGETPLAPEYSKQFPESLLLPARERITSKADAKYSSALHLCGEKAPVL